MEFGGSWSLKRLWMYEICARKYRYHYHDSHLAYKDDCLNFHQKLYERRHERSLDRLFTESLHATLPLLFCEGYRSKLLNNEFNENLYNALQSYPSSDREGLADSFFVKFGDSVSKVMKLQEFSWISPIRNYTYRNDFVKFDADGAQIDLFLPLVWRQGKYINVLRITQKECVQAELDLNAFYFLKVYGNDFENFVLWNLIINDTSCKILKKTPTYESLIELRESIMNTTSLLNNWQNDFPFSENMALCQACKYYSLCEKFDN